jgi:hypothetical protein
LIVESYGQVADCIARKAYKLGKDESYNSPFAKGAKKAGRYFAGGKHDDITITVAQLFKESEGNERKAHTEDFFEKLVTVYTVSPIESEEVSTLRAKTAGWDEL